MNFLESYPVCDNCEYAKLLYCQKYEKDCISINLSNSTHMIPCEECLLNDSFKNKENQNQLKKIQNKALFHIPDLSILDNILLLLEKKKQFPDAFYENREIIEIYDSFPGALWNGRNPMFNKEFLSIQDINSIKNKLESNNLSLNLTWNNHLIKDKYLYDTYSNCITELFNNGLHSITVASDELLTYLKEYYPNYTFYQSHIKSERQLNLELNNKYDIYVAPKSYNNNWEILDIIKKEDRNKIEFLCNDICFPSCSKNLHYETVNQHLILGCNETCDHTCPCLIDHNFSFYNTKRWPTTINPEDIDEYLDKNFIHFKLAGRGEQKEILLYKICKYFIKPNFFDDIYFSII